PPGLERVRKRPSRRATRLSTQSRRAGEAQVVHYPSGGSPDASKIHLNGDSWLEPQRYTSGESKRNAHTTVGTSVSRNLAHSRCTDGRDSRHGRPRPLADDRERRPVDTDLI